MIYYSYC